MSVELQQSSIELWKCNSFPRNMIRTYVNLLHGKWKEYHRDNNWRYNQQFDDFGFASGWTNNLYQSNNGRNQAWNHCMEGYLLTFFQMNSGGLGESRFSGKMNKYWLVYLTQSRFSTEYWTITHKQKNTTGIHWVY